MRRAVLTLGGTAAGIAALLAVKFHPSAASTPTAGTVMPPPSAGATSAGTAGEPAATGRAAASSAPRSSTGTGGGTTQSSAGRSFTGSVDNTAYGPMQVQVTVAGKAIAKITVLQQTNTGTESQSIDNMAIPQLTKEALAAQSAKIDAVSGASYTSAGYIKSLQSALDQAGL